MIKELFGSKEILKHDLGYCKLYDTKFNGSNCTKMYFMSDSPNHFEAVKSSINYNIIPILKITQHSVFTKRVIPFKNIFSRGHVRYNEYVIKKLKETVDYLHSELKIEHNQIEIDALFVDDCGNVLLGKFRRSKFLTEEGERRDELMLNDLCKSLLGIEIIDLNYKKSLFEDLEKRDLFSTLSNEEKREFLLRAYENRDELIDAIKTNILNISIQDISRSNDKDYKLNVLDILFKLDPEMIKNFSKILFGIIDSSVRLYLLQNMKNVNNLEDSVDEICLGLRVKDKTLRMETLNFIFKNEKCFSLKAINHIIDIISVSVNDGETMGLACKLFCELQRDGIGKAIYKLAMQFLTIDKNKGSTYRLIEKHFIEFDKYKLSTEMLPILCSKLTDRDEQDFCFILVEKIFNHLRKYKSEISNKEWSLKKIFNQKKQDSDAASQIIAKLSKEENHTEWDEQDIS